MAAPTYASATLTSTSGMETSDLDVALPATVNAGDLLIIWICCDGARSFDFTGTGFTELQDANSGDVSAAVAYKDAAGTEGGTTVNVSWGAAEQAFAVCFRYTGDVDAGTYAPESPTPATGTGTSLDPPSATHSKGSDDYAVLALAVQDTYLGGFTVYPYANNNNEVNSSTGGSACEGAWCTTTVSGTATENPGAFTNSRSDGWVAMTVMIPSNASGGGGSTVPVLYHHYRTMRAA